MRAYKTETGRKFSALVEKAALLGQVYGTNLDVAEELEAREGTKTPALLARITGAKAAAGTADRELDALARQMETLQAEDASIPRNDDDSRMDVKRARLGALMERAALLREALAKDPDALGAVFQRKHLAELDAAAAWETKSIRDAEQARDDGTEPVSEWAGLL